MYKKAVVLGAGGFIGGHLVRYLKEAGYFVRAVDIKVPEFGDARQIADEYQVRDLRI